MQMNISTPRCPHLSLPGPFAFRASVVQFAAAPTATAFTNTNRPSVLPPSRSTLTAEFGGDRMVSPEVAHSAVQAGNAILLDVREFGEMAYSGAAALATSMFQSCAGSMACGCRDPFVDKALGSSGREGRRC